MSYQTNEYRNQHYKVRRQRSKASGYSCAKCGKPAQEWSWIHDTDRWNTQNYRPMCRVCHYRYDEIGKQNANKLRGRTLPREHKAKVSAALLGGRTKNNKSGIAGVYWHKKAGKWEVNVSGTYFGLYEDFTEAIRIRNAKAVELQGPHAKQYNIDGSLT